MAGFFGYALNQPIYIKRDLSLSFLFYSFPLPFPFCPMIFSQLTISSIFLKFGYCLSKTTSKRILSHYCMSSGNSLFFSPSKEKELSYMIEGLECVSTLLYCVYVHCAHMPTKLQSHKMSHKLFRVYVNSIHVLASTSTHTHTNHHEQSMTHATVQS